LQLTMATEEMAKRSTAESHNGLQKKAISLKKQWKNKTHSDDGDVFWSKVKRKRGLDKGTLEVQAVVDSLWNKRVREEFELEMNNITGRVLSGVLHVDEEHAHLSKVEILQIRRDVLQTFYTD
ncbi:hypothetical protein BGZ47_003678, partial [Haplosporangium gracile]